MARPTLIVDEEFDAREVKPVRARPAIPIITPAPTSTGSGMATDAGGSRGNLGGMDATAPADPGAAALNSPTRPMLGAMPSPLSTPPIGDDAALYMHGARGGFPAGPPNPLTHEMNPNNPANVARRAASPNPLISGPEQDVARMGQRQQVVDSANTGGSYGYAVSPGGFGLTPQQAIALGFQPPAVTRTAPNLAYGGANITPRPQAVGMYAEPMSVADAQAILNASGPGVVRAAQAAQPGVTVAPRSQPGQRSDESAEQFAARKQDIARSNMENADLGSRRAEFRRSRQALTGQARDIAKLGDTESAAALLSQAAGMQLPQRATPATVARQRETDSLVRDRAGSDTNATRLQVSRDTTERERLRQEGLNNRAQRKQEFDQRMADNKARLATVSEANRTRANGLVRQIETIGRQIQKQEEYVGGETGAAAEQRIKVLEGNRERVQKQLDQIFGEQTPSAAATDAIGTMNGQPVTEADIQTTMKAHNMTREQVLAALAQRGFTSNAR